MMTLQPQLIYIANAVRQYHVVVFVLVTSALLFSFGNSYNSDEGTILNGAWKMFQGRHLYTDFFSFFAPGSYLFTLGSFYLFGPYYFSARILSVFLLVLSVYSVYAIGALLSDKKVGICAAIFWMICSFLPIVVINHNTLSSYLASIAVWLLIVALKKKQIIFFICSGLMFGGVTVFLQTKGIILDAGFLLFLFVYMIKGMIIPRQMVLFTVSCALLPLAMIWYWGMPLLYRLLIEWPLNHYPTVNHVSFIPLFISLALYGILIYRALRYSRQTDTSIVTILIVTQICLFLSIVNRPDIPHILWNSFGMVLLASYTIYARMKSLFLPIYDMMFIEIPLMIVFSFSIALAMHSIQLEHAFKKTIEKLSLTSMYAHPFLPEFYFEFGVPDPYPYDILVSGMYAHDAFDANLRILIKEKPEYIFTNYAMVSKFHYQKENPLDDYIAHHYHAIDHFLSTLIMKKNEHIR